MKNDTHLCFIFPKVRFKAEEQGATTECPFCKKSRLSGIIDQDGSITLVKNKYQTLEHAFQTVLIETDKCNSYLTEYPVEHLQKVLEFGFKHWDRMEESGEYKSVVFFKNHGPLSGGTVGHAHMQIAGLKNLDYMQHINEKIFIGIEVYREQESIVNVALQPNATAVEFNIIVPSKHNTRFLAENIRKVVKYALGRHNCSSYNLFFFKREKFIICRVVPRYVTSPYLIGYYIPQVIDSLESIVYDLKKSCYTDS